MKEFVVYEHWLDGKCIYVGSGKIRRANDFHRNEKYETVTLNRKKDIQVKIVDYFNSRVEAVKFEMGITLQRKDEGHPLCNINIGNKWGEGVKEKQIASHKGKLSGDLNPSKRKDVREKISKAVSGERNGMYGKRSPRRRMIKGYNLKTGEEVKFDGLDAFIERFGHIFRHRKTVEYLNGGSYRKIENSDWTFEYMEECNL